MAKLEKPQEPGRTNEKLYFAGMHLDQLKRVLADEKLFHRDAVASSYRESFVFHCYGAYHALLQELCRFYKLPALDSCEAIRVAMAEKGQVSPEVTQMEALIEDSGSWLGALVVAWREILYPPKRKDDGHVDEQNESGVGMIRMVEAPQQRRTIDAADVQQMATWLASLKAQIAEFRKEMQEW